MKLISNRCDVCGTKLAGRRATCADCERTERHASLLELYSRFDDREDASRRAEWMSAAIARVAAHDDDPDLATALESSLRSKLAATG